ncbi:MAG: ABC transporter permease [Myxococcota bacterium]
MRTLSELLASAGRAALGIVETAGLMALLAWRAMGTLLRVSVPLREILKQVHANGATSLPVIIIASICVGCIVAVQGMDYAQRYSAPEVYGWAAYFAACREVGPLLLGLSLSARLGAQNAAQLAALTVTERVDAMKALGVDTTSVWVTPRLIAMPIAATVLMLWMDGISLVSATVFAWIAGGVTPWTTWASIMRYALLSDLLLGLEKAAVYGLFAALTSTALGLAARGGADAVGTAVMKTAVTSLLVISAVHYALTVWTAG